MPTLGEVLPRLLQDMGIDTVFGIPGVHTVELYRGLPATKLRHITPRHEQGAGFMADGYARVSGRPAACFIISGPGMTNITTAMGQAYADSIPMLVISSVLNRDEIGRGEGRLHELKDQSATAEGVAAWSHTVMSPADLPAVLNRAAATFNSARPRPVHIELPLDVIVAEAGDLQLGPSVPCRPAPDAAAIGRAADMLRGAKRPLMIVGGGASGAPEAIRRLADILGAPVVPTINAKGILPPDHPLLIGSLLPQPPVLDELAAADVVLAIGTELGETDTLLMGGYPQIDGALIRIDIEAEQLTRNAAPTLGIVSDAGAAATALAEALKGPALHDGASRADRLRRAALEDVDPAYAAHGRILTRLAGEFPGLIVAGDSTQPVYGANMTYDAPQPRSYFNSSTGFGTLGYGLPAASGAKLACPDRPVVSLIGDGAFQFTLPELATAVELGLPLPILLWNNQGYGEIKTYMAERQIPQIGVDIYTPDFQAITKGFGANAVKADSLDALIMALKTAFAADGPTVIELDDAKARTW
ncbi:hypothetical protein DC366_12690 [Pelagivirga sediminicola]|uniref:5-guanidino-2-oxopentanoate decarboxylase n=1 Tax=Pelagivirga sediminicola TaxID=2170575 RepID=A0A2T7G544_9RHOB|nr:5-guanidino-2-oxopentanoate decarboxylase [Pelagivirga sediminicola]PVA09552.1 hypothetical protein DC366_12690 [Pelagivirga sediminicola]